MNIYYSEVTLLLESFMFLFEPIYKNIYLTITKLDILYIYIYWGTGADCHGGQ